MVPSTKIGFIGAGNMAQALGISIINKELFSSSQVYVSAPSKRNFKRWEELKVNTTHDNNEIVSKCDIIILAVKPQFIDEALKQITPVQNRHVTSKLVVSIIAGLTLETLHTKLQPILREYRLVKVMPNIALSVGEGCSAISPDKSASEDDVKTITTIMSCGGTYEIVPESSMHAACALCGSGIAFIFSIIEALSDGAVKQGIPRSQSYKLAAQTILGAAKMVLETGEHPGILKDNVCSPGGTTIHGIYALERGNVRFSLIDAIEASTNRGFELNEKNKK